MRGRYKIWVVTGGNWHELWQHFDGEKIEITAEAPGYVSDTIYIDPYTFGNSYVRDFELDPE